MDFSNSKRDSMWINEKINYAKKVKTKFNSCLKDEIIQYK